MSNYNFIDAATARQLSPSDVQPGDAFPIKVVAVVGHGDDWAAYYGPTNYSDEAVAAIGDKLSAAQAEPLFYVLRNSDRYYRE